jgi:hypothetical protein
MINTRKYLITFLITAAIFGTAFFISSVLSQKKLADVRSIESRVALDILSSEVQFALLEETSCQDIGPGFLSKELGPLGERIAYAETQSGFDSRDLEYLKRSYFLLEIKDYLLMKKLTEKCAIEPTFILYFYSSEGSCRDCEKMGHVLTLLRERYPELRVYSFDYDLDLEAINSLVSIYKIEPNMPAMVINNKQYYGYHSAEELEEGVPALALLAEARARVLAEEEALQESAATTSPNSTR